MKIDYKKYPLIFADTEQYIECGNGWYDLLDAMFECIQKDLEKTPRPNFKITQIKEKFGILRIYIENSNQYIDKIILQAKSMSEHICETCGEYGQLRDSSYWKKVRCNDCERKHFATQQPLSPEAKAALDAGIKSAQEQTLVYLGSFAQYADEED